MHNDTSKIIEAVNEPRTEPGLSFQLFYLVNLNRVALSSARKGLYIAT